MKLLIFLNIFVKFSSRKFVIVLSAKYYALA